MLFFRPKFWPMCLGWVVAIGLAASTHAVAQEEGGGGESAVAGGSFLSSLGYGGRLGATISGFDNNQPHTGSKIGFTIGAFAEYPINDLVAVQVDLAYAQQGGTFVQFRDDTRFGAEGSFVNRNVKEASVTLHNVYIPLQAKFSPLPNPMFPKLLIGPYADFNFFAQESYQRTGVVNQAAYVTATGNDVVTDQYERLHVGALVGVQFELPFQNNMLLLVNATYKYGLTPVKRQHSYIDFNEVANDMTNNAFILTMGVRL